MSATAHRSPLLWLVALGIAGTPFLVATTADRVTTHNFNIDSQPLGDALQEFAVQGEVQVVFFSDLVEGLTAPEIHGHYTLAAALDLLLAESGLTFRIINPATIEIRASEPPVDP